MSKVAGSIDKFPKTWRGAVVATSPVVQVSMARLIDMRDLESNFCPAKFLSEAQDLVESLDAKSVVVWATDISGNQAAKTVMFAYDSDGGEHITESWVRKSAPLYAGDSNRLDMTHQLTRLPLPTENIQQEKQSLIMATCGHV